MALESSPRQTVLNKIIGSIKSSPMEVRIMTNQEFVVWQLEMAFEQIRNMYKFPEDWNLPESAKDSLRDPMNHIQDALDAARKEVKPQVSLGDLEALREIKRQLEGQA